MTKPKAKDTVAVQDSSAAADQVERQTTDALLRVRAARPQGFRRAGFTFGREPRDLPLSLLTDAQIEMLKAEPNLSVEEIEAPDDAA